MDFETGEPVGGREEHEGLWRHDGKKLIGTADGSKPDYCYQITELEWELGSISWSL